MQKDHGKSLWFYPLGLGTHYVVAVVGGMLLGFIPEDLLSRFYRFSSIQAFAPGIGVTALLLGFFVSHRFRDLPLASWIWVIGSIWFFCGVHELTSSWSPSWSHERSAWEYAKTQLFSPRCGDTECLYQLFYTVPLVASVMYSVGAVTRILRERNAYDQN
jgi:hypothetical protein